jgi:phospholipid transport system transporter-binding protein
VFVLPPELTHTQARACLQMLVQRLRQHKKREVVVDASTLQRFDSSALAVLLEFRRECLAMGQRFSIQGLAPKLADLATLYGIAELLPAA